MILAIYTFCSCLLVGFVLGCMFRDWQEDKRRARIREVEDERVRQSYAAQGKPSPPKFEMVIWP